MFVIEGTVSYWVLTVKMDPTACLIRLHNCWRPTVVEANLTIEQSQVAENCQYRAICTFTTRQLRISKAPKVSNFVEWKKTNLGLGSKAIQPLLIKVHYVGQQLTLAPVHHRNYGLCWIQDALKLATVPLLAQTAALWHPYPSVKNAPSAGFYHHQIHRRRKAIARANT